MENNREKIEEVVKKCTDRLGGVSNNQVQSLVDRLSKMPNMKSIVDFLALNIDKVFGEEKQKANYEASMQDILELSNGEYKSINEIIAQVQKNKAQNYTPRKYFS